MLIPVFVPLLMLLNPILVLIQTPSAPSLMLSIVILVLVLMFVVMFTFFAFAWFDFGFTFAGFSFLDLLLLPFFSFLAELKHLCICQQG